MAMKNTNTNNYSALRIFKRVCFKVSNNNGHNSQKSKKNSFKINKNSKIYFALVTKRAPRCSKVTIEHLIKVKSIAILDISKLLPITPEN